MKETTFSRKLFGKEISILIYGDNANRVKQVLEQTYAEALRLQKIFNFFDKRSELSILNYKRKLKVSPELLSVIKNALPFSKLTNGKYDISLGKRIINRKNNKDDIKLQSSYEGIKIRGNKIILLHPDIFIDLGSIAKGYITDRLGEFLKLKGINEFLIDSRGDIIVSGKSVHIIGIQHPRDSEKNLFSIKLKNQAVATSGDYNQSYKNFSNSHIINSNDIISLTIVAPTLEEADVYSTALFVSNEKERSNLIKHNKDIKILMIKKDLKPVFYNNFEELLYE